MKPKLTLTFDADFGQKYSMCIDLDDHTAREFQHVPLPTPIEFGGTFDECVEVLEKREFRKDVFQRECWRLGTLLAERMEDAEGWHDVSRIEPAKRALAND